MTTGKWLWRSSTGSSTAYLKECLGFHSEPVSELSAMRWSEKSTFMDDLAEQFPMPPYFGMNWDAVDECVPDLCDGGRLIIIRRITNESKNNVARFVDLVAGMWQQENRFHPQGKVAVVLEPWKEPTIRAEWADRTACEYRVLDLCAADRE